MRTGRGVTEPRVLVHYAGIRRETRDGDILLFRGKSWISRIICRVTRSPYSHAAIVAWWDERLMVLEAVGKGIVVSRMSVGRLVFGRPRREAADPEAPLDDFVCSEFVSRVWRAGGIDLVGDSPDMYTKPSDIAKSPHVRKVGGVVRGQPTKLTGDSLDRLPTSAAGAQ